MSSSVYSVSIGEGMRVSLFGRSDREHILGSVASIFSACFGSFFAIHVSPVSMVIFRRFVCCLMHNIWGCW